MRRKHRVDVKHFAPLPNTEGIAWIGKSDVPPDPDYVQITTRFNTTGP